MFFKLAALNLRKHLKRTLLVLFAIAISVVVMVFVEGLMTGLQKSFFQSIFQDSGHIQLHKQGWQDRLDPYSLDYTISNPDADLSRLRKDPRVTDAEKILPFGALVLHGDKNMPMGGYGIQPDTTYFTRAREGMLQGHLPQSDNQIAISKRTGELLGVSYRDPLVVLVQDSTGSAFYYEYTVAGVFATGSDQFDTSTFFVTHSAAQDLLYLGNATIEIRVNLQDPSMADAFQKDMSGWAAGKDLEIKTWKQIHGSFIVMFEFFDIFMIFIDLLVVIVTATVITNAILMNVFERTAEFGTLRAIGLKKRQQFGMIISEGVIQGVLGSVIGLLAGVGFTLYVASVGIDMGGFAESVGLSSTIYPALTVANGVRSFGAGVLISIVGSLYASLVSTRMRIVDMFGGEH